VQHHAFLTLALRSMWVVSYIMPQLLCPVCQLNGKLGGTQI